MCGKTGDVYPDYGHICAECLDGSEFLDEIIVTPDLPPGGGGENACSCGSSCNCLNNGSLICACTPEDNPETGCSYCQSPGCNGECQNSGGGNGNNGIGSVNINWTNNTTFNGIFQSVLNENNALLQQTKTNVENAQIQVNLVFSDTLSVIAGGKFGLNNAFQGKPYTIMFNYDFNALNLSAKKIIIYHEMLHLNVYAMLKGFRLNTIETAVPGLNRCHAIWGNDYNEMQHEFFASNYLEQIADMIRTVAPNLDAEKAKWGSLLKTKEFEALGMDERNSIREYLKENEL